MRSYQVDVNRRHGSHGGHSTEWEFDTEAGGGRVLELQKLGQPLLVDFSFGTDGAWFCVLRDDENPGARQLVPLLVAYLTAWPGEEAEALALIAAYPRPEPGLPYGWGAVVGGYVRVGDGATVRRHNDEWWCGRRHVGSEWERTLWRSGQQTGAEAIREWVELDEAPMLGGDPDPLTRSSR